MPPTVALKDNLISHVTNPTSASVCNLTKGNKLNFKIQIINNIVHQDEKWLKLQWFSPKCLECSSSSPVVVTPLLLEIDC